MNPEKIIRYTLPLFVIAIVSRAIEEVSFMYYAVPVLCIFYIGYILIWVRNEKSKVKLSPIDEDTSTEFIPNKLGLSVKDSVDQAMNENVSSFRRNQESNIKQQSDPLFATLNIFHQPSSILLFFLPGLWFLSTAMWSSYPEITATRALYFILLSIGCLSAGMLWIRYSGKTILDFLLPANVLVVVVCLFSLVTGIPSDSWTGGNGKGLMGLFGHQNLLASVLLFTLPSVIAKLMDIIKNKTTTHQQLPTTNYLLLTTYFLILASNLLLLFLTYSRAAIVSLLFGVVIFLILNRNWKVLAYGFASVSAVFLIIYFTPPLNQSTAELFKKDFPEFYTSRMWMFEPSYRAALNGGLTGLGYGISDPNEKVGGMGDHFEDERFIREKGNSTLALVEETGLIGLILFLLPITFILFNKNRIVILNEMKNLSPRDEDFSPSVRNDRIVVNPNAVRNLTTNYSLLTATIAALLLHAQFEAWWVGVGSVQLPIFFIYFGLIVNKFSVRSSMVKGSEVRS